MKIKHLLAAFVMGSLLFSSPALALDVKSIPGTPDVVSELPLTIQVDGGWLPTDTTPIIRNGRTLIPLRSAGEAIGATVTWDQATRTATAELNGLVVKFILGSKIYTVNGHEYATDVAPTMQGWRTMLPIRAFGEAFGVGVSWDAKLRNVNIDTPAENAPKPMHPNGGDPEYSYLLMKYYVPKDPNDPIIGTYLGSQFTANRSWEQSAISIYKDSNGVIKTAIIDDVIPAYGNRGYGTIEAFVNTGGGYNEVTPGSKFVIKAGPDHEYLKGNNMLLNDSKYRHYTIINGGLIHTHKANESGFRYPNLLNLKLEPIPLY